ncbi:hypothetical protein [Ferrimonas marina]|uniref:Lipoprotein n=1 Tax=Ferrimonas marina TaxID=299255 RepID=A0A1M5VXV8_9GAMM|nr:hypothetical protein [Ferrimonas marina]SHH80010.1 hypothetical protein SAMN02745129_3053 [Ferrimonas marina]
MIKPALLVAASLLLTACVSTYDDVRPGRDGIHQITVYDRDQQESMRNALNQSRAYCRSLQQSMFVISEETRYQGTLPQAEFERQKALANAASQAGDRLQTQSSSQGANDVGRLLSGVAGSLDDSLQEPYEAKLQFECQ